MLLDDLREGAGDRLWIRYIRVVSSDSRDSKDVRLPAVGRFATVIFFGLKVFLREAGYQLFGLMFRFVLCGGISNAIEAKRTLVMTDCSDRRWQGQLHLLLMLDPLPDPALEHPQ
jgi:hypothetical protein